MCAGWPMNASMQAFVARLRSAGHDVFYVAEIASGATDEQVIQRAHEDGRMPVTEDKDFGDLVFRLDMAAPGIVLLRVSPGEHLLKWTRLEAAIAQFGERLIGRYVVIEEGRFRSRPLRR